MRLEVDSLTPLYQQVIDSIRAGIEEGEYQVGQKIPSESELSELYSVSRITVRRAIEELASAGYLTKKQGKGTYVNPRKIDKKVMQTSRMQSFTNMCELANRKPGAHLMMRKRGVSRPQEAAMLGLEEGAEVLVIRRLRTADEIPIMLSTMVFPADEFAFLMDEDLEDKSLFAVLEERRSRRPSKATKVHLELSHASAEFADDLKVPIGEPLFDERGVFVDEDGKAVLTCHARIVASMYSFSI